MRAGACRGCLLVPQTCFTAARERIINSVDERLRIFTARGRSLQDLGTCACLRCKYCSLRDRRPHGMEELANLGDPLAINLREQTAVLLAQLPERSPYAHSLQNASNSIEILNILSYLLSLPAYTTAVATAFRPILLDLCARWLHDEENELERFEALCLMLEIHLEVYPYVCFLPGSFGADCLG